MPFIIRRPPLIVYCRRIHSVLAPLGRELRRPWLASWHCSQIGCSGMHFANDVCRESHKSKQDARANAHRAGGAHWFIFDVGQRMLRPITVTVVIALFVAGCVSRPTISSETFAPNELAALEAFFRYFFDHNVSGKKKNASAYCLFLRQANSDVMNPDAAFRSPL